MGIEILLTTSRSLAASTRAMLDKLVAGAFENVDPPEDGRIEVDCLDGESGEEWGFVAPETGAMEAFARIKEKPTTVRVKISLRTGHLILFPGFVVLSRPDDEYEDFEDDPRAKQIILREAMELGRFVGAKEVLVAGDAASDFLGEDATTWSELREVLSEEEVPHKLVPVKATKPDPDAAE
jgi:hypothetical protein